MMIEDWPAQLEGIPEWDLEDVATQPVQPRRLIGSRARAIAGALGALGSILVGAVYQFSRRDD